MTFKKEKKLKSFLHDRLLNLHKEFEKRTNIKMFFNIFLKHKPFYVVYIKCDSRITCACVKHLNMQLKLNKLNQVRIIKTNNFSEM